MQNKKNVLEICNQLGIGGTEKVMQIFCKYLDRNKFNVFACGIFKGGERENIIKKYVKKLLVSNGNIEEIKKFILENNIEIVHWHSISQNPGIEFDKSIELLEFLKSKNIKIIETSPFSLYNEKIDNLLDLKLFVSQVNLLKYLWKFGNKLKDKNKYNFLYNPLDVEELKQYLLSEKEKKELRNKYGIGENDFVIGKVGRANLWKWDDTIIDIVPKLIKKISNIKIVVRAIPKLKKKKIIKLGIEKYFIFLEETVSERDICETYQVMDIMLHTSRIGECNSVAINEGLFFGIPIITKSTDFMQKTIFERDNGQIEIIENGINGYVENDLNKISNYIIELYDDKNKLLEIGENNKKKSTQIFGVKNIIKKLEDFFEGKIEKKLDFTLEKYKKKVLKENFFYRMKENLKAIIDKFIFKA